MSGFSRGNAPAIMATRLSAFWSENQVRIAFGDQVEDGQPIVWHSHVVMSIGNAEALIGLLENLKAQCEAKKAVKN